MINIDTIKKIYVVYRITKGIYNGIRFRNSSRLSDPDFRSISELGEEKPLIITMLASMAKQASVDGTITKEEKEYVEFYLSFDCSLDNPGIKWGMRHFNKAASGNTSLKDYAKEYYSLVNGDYDKCYKYICMLMQLSYKDSELNQREIKSIREVIKMLHLPKSCFDKILFDVKLSGAIPYDRVKNYGTGFIISNDGYVITNYHNIRRAKEILVTSENNLHEATLMECDKKADLALLRIFGKFKAIPYCLEYPYLGQSVFTIGFPQPVYQGFLPKISTGTICGLTGSKDNINHLQIDSNINRGNSGGPLIDSEMGYLVGVVKAVLKKGANRVSYAIRPEVLQKFLDESFVRFDKRLNKPKKKRKKFKYIIEDSKQSVVQVFSCKKESSFF